MKQENSQPHLGDLSANNPIKIENMADAIVKQIAPRTILVVGPESKIISDALSAKSIKASVRDALNGDADEIFDLVIITLVNENVGSIDLLCDVSDLILLCPFHSNFDRDWLSLTRLLTKFASFGFGPRQDFAPDLPLLSLALLERRKSAVSAEELRDYACLFSVRMHVAAEVQDLEERHSAALSLAADELARMEHKFSAIVSEQAQVYQALHEIRDSTSWRITAPYRLLGHLIVRANQVRRTVKNLAGSHSGYVALLKAAIRVISREGLRGAIKASKSYVNSNIALQGRNYDLWLKTYATIDEKVRLKIRTDIASWENPPLISIVMPVYNPEASWLREAIESVQKQIYTNWELCIADDGSTSAQVKKILDSYVARDSRIKVVYRLVNGHISEASNSSLELATGEWMSLLDQDDLLTEDALYYVARMVIEKPQLDLVYSDEDKIENGHRFDPYFKTDWDLELLRSHNMACHLSTFRIARVRDLGGFRKGFEGSQDYDLVLRFSEGLPPTSIGHIPRVLYHWRVHPNSTAQTSSNKSYAAVAGQKALSEHLQRVGVDGIVEILNTGMYRTRYSLPKLLPLVTLIIPTRNGMLLTSQCITSILQKTTYPNYEIIVVDNNSDDLAALQYFDDIQSDPRVRVIRDKQPFNYSAINNRAVKLANGDYIALINNDIEVITPDWLSEMMSLAVQQSVGCVGARLWYPDEKLQHGGVIIGLGGVAGHSHKMLRRGDPGYFRRAELTQSFSAVTAACLVVSKAIYEKVEGLNEVDLTIAFNDVDFCLKVREAGYRNVWTPYAELYHHESATRGFEDTPEKIERFRGEIAYMQDRWKTHLRPDPAYNSNLTLSSEDFSLSWPPRNRHDPTLAS